jgi:septal ring factor EnvC (AmiA/AmiB activator)
VLLKFNLAFVLLLLSSGISAEQDSSQRLDDVRGEIKTLSTDLSQKKADKETLYQQLKAQSRKVSDLNRELRKIQQEIKDKNTELKQLRAQMGIKQSEQNQQLEALYEQMRAAFVVAEPGYLEMLLNQQDVATLSRGSTYFRYFHQARESQLAAINDILNQLNEEQKQLLLSQQSLEKMLTQQQQQQQVLQQETEKRQATLKSLEQAISGQDARLAALKDEEKSLQQLLDSLAKQQQAAPPPKPNITAQKPNTPFSRLTGRLAWPVSGKLLANYGSPRNLGKLKWQGIVIASPTGNEVRATAAGQIVFADWLRGFGLLVIIDHGEQYMTLYGNNETLLREAGEYVQAGDIIAQSGEQGIRGLAGLYFEIRHRGSPTDPLKWLGKQG